MSQQTGIKKDSYYRDVLLKFRAHKLAMIGVAIIAAEVLLVVLLPMILKLDPYTSDILAFSAPPGPGHFLGTDDTGRDVFARLIYGGRVSLLVGLLSAIISLLIGVPLGLIAGYYKGIWETIVMRAADIFMSFPSMILVLVLVSVIGPSVWTVTLVIGVLGWTDFAKLIYGNVLSVREKEYVESARAVGTKDIPILVKYVIPNAFAPILINFTFRTAQAIIQESALSFLGMGVQPPEASWGNILYAAQSITVLSSRPWLWVPPGILLVLTVSSINFIGDGIRDALDSRTKIKKKGRKNNMKRKSAKAAAAALVCMMALSACGKADTTGTPGASETVQSQAEPQQNTNEGGEKVITIAQTGDWDTFMVMNTTNAGADNINELMFDRLMTINTDGTFEPRLADSWETNEAQDKIIYHLNENAVWHDGEPVTAEDVVYSAQVASSAEYNYLRRIRMQYFAGTDETGCELSENSVEVAAVDDHTVEFTLKSPMDPSIIYALVNRDFFIIPEHLLSGISDAELVNSPFWQKPVGSGPCIFDSMESGVSVEFKANKDYYLGTPDFDRLVFKKVQSSNLLSGLMSGEIDALSGNTQLPLADWDAACSTEGVTAKSVPTFAYQYMAMNTSRDYLTEDIRHAISLAINRQVIVDQLLMGQGRVAIGPLPDDHKYRNQDIQPEYNPEKAKEMVEAAGWDANRELEVLVSTGNEVREKSAILIQQDLQKIGIKTRIQTLDFPTLLTNARNGDYDLCFIGSAGSVDPSESVPNVTAGYMNNFTQLTDPTLGEVGESGAKEITFEARKAVYDEYQQILFDQMPMAFLYFTNDLFAYSSSLENVREGAIDYNVNKNVWAWKVNK